MGRSAEGTKYCWKFQGRRLKSSSIFHWRGLNIVGNSMGRGKSAIVNTWEGS